MTVAIFWYRRDLRIHDNAGLYHALKSGLPVVPVFIFDRQILAELDNPKDRRITFIYKALENLQANLTGIGCSLDVRYGTTAEIWKQLLADYDIGAVYTNHDYEPYAIARDAAVTQQLLDNGIDLHTFKDQCIFEKNEVLKDDGKPYTVFSPYARKWHKQLASANSDFYVRSYPSEKYQAAFHQQPTLPLPALVDMGFERTQDIFPDKTIDPDLLSQYGNRRDLPAIQGTSRLSVHLRFGTVSIRQMAQKGLASSEKWLNELIWRDFYMMILWHFPHVVHKAFKPAYDHIAWRNNEEEFAAWCEGRTGYPIVDAGMRELLATGFMHNRVRMVVASFLTKHLLIDWRWGEAYFAKHLLDFELSSNNGGWQWAAGSGCDAAPYFRIFNPYTQTKKFDPKLAYVRKWVPEFQAFDYPLPIVEHPVARARALATYKNGLEKAKAMVA